MRKTIFSSTGYIYVLFFSEGSFKERRIIVNYQPIFLIRLFMKPRAKK